MKYWFLFIFALQEAAWSLPMRDIAIDGKHRLRVEIAQTVESRSQGLMGRTQLAKDSGMLFIFDSPQRLSFWMKDTFIPLSIGYFDENKVLKEVHAMAAQNMMEKKQDLRRYPSNCDCLYALEVNQGWFNKNEVKVGARLRFVDSPSLKTQLVQ